MIKRSLWILLSATTILSACDLAPKFAPPDVHPPAAFKEQPTAIPADEKQQWKSVQPLEAKDRGEWWRVFGDMELDRLEREAAKANPTLQAAASRVKEARAVARSHPSASLLPDLDIGANAVRAKPSAASFSTFGIPVATTKPYTLFDANGTLSYEVDLFQRISNTHEAFLKDADAEEATYRSFLLALQADVAQNYYYLRQLDAERQVLRETVKIRTEAARIMQKRFDLGDVSDQDHAQTQSELAAAKADLVGINRSRETAEHALAILLGKLPSEFNFAESPLTDVPPQIPSGLPADLLTRRPDIAAGIASMQAANARIGAARAAFFPSLSLSAVGGFESNKIADLFKWSTRTWALGQLAGNALTMPIFDNGVNSANLDLAKSGYEESVANYRAQVLTAFKEVEDNLADQQLLSSQSLEQDRSSEAAARATRISKLRYDGGESNYTEVVDAERISLAARRGSVQLRAQRFLTTVSLIRALGGGWDSPKP